jgi:Domain of unknown function (DUF4263)
VKTFDSVRLNVAQCGRDLDDFGNLLASRDELSETRDVLPFFRQRPHISAMLGSYLPSMLNPERVISYEYRLYGDFATDLVIGDPSRASFCFVEFEDALPTSVFGKGSRSIPVWSSRFQNAFSQVVDWFWSLSEFQATPHYSRTFGSHLLDCMALLVIGRSEHLGPRERDRLHWFRQNVSVHSRHVHCCTFDELYEDLRLRYELFS